MSVRLPHEKEIIALHNRYASSEDMFSLVYDHCKIVRDIAIWCAGKIEDEVDIDLLEAICLLHDIGSYSFMYDSYDRNTYAQHALLGSKILESEGIDTTLCKAVETHVLMGLTKEEIASSNLRLPERDFLPTSIEARLLCYADRFHSKQPVFNSYDFFVGSNADLPAQIEKFKKEAEVFGVPDIKELAKKYGHQIR